jgi:hypothetical protein
MNMIYSAERNAVRWETATEYGFEHVEEPVATLAALLVQSLFDQHNSMNDFAR